jgi:hypothetical protein
VLRTLGRWVEYLGGPDCAPFATGAVSGQGSLGLSDTHGDRLAADIAGIPRRVRHHPRRGDRVVIGMMRTDFCGRYGVAPLD